MRKRVLVVHNYLSPFGGGNAVAMWTLEALRGTYDLGLLTWQPFGLDAMNRFYGTTLDEGDIRIHYPPRWLRQVVPPARFNLWKHYYLLRQCRRMRPEYDVAICTYNEGDLGGDGIQYVHFPFYYDPRVNPRLRHPLQDYPQQWFHRSTLLMTAYFRLCELTMAFSRARMRRNVTLVNSEWTASRMKEAHGVDAITVYPPVPGTFPAVPWDQRETGFVCIGRIAAEKRIELIIAILSGVRRRGHNVHLHIIGSAGDRDYFERVQALQRDNASWVSLELHISRAQLAELASQHRYGIHAMRNEHFGIAVAEMVRAGCIVFVQRSAGPLEIVAGHEALTYQTPEEAVDKIVAVLGNAAQQEELRQHLARRKELYSTTEFTRRIRELVDRCEARAT